MSKKNKTNRAAAAPTPPAAKAEAIPKFLDDAGNLVMTKLKGRDFPKGRDGRIAYCRYQSAKWAMKGDKEMQRGDPTTKKLAKIDKLEKMLALLQSEVAEAKANEK